MTTPMQRKDEAVCSRIREAEVMWRAYGARVVMGTVRDRDGARVTVWRLFKGGPIFYHTRLLKTGPKGPVAKAKWPDLPLFKVCFAEALQKHEAAE